MSNLSISEIYARNQATSVSDNDLLLISKYNNGIHTSAGIKCKDFFKGIVYDPNMTFTSIRGVFSTGQHIALDNRVIKTFSTEFTIPYDGIFYIFAKHFMKRVETTTSTDLADYEVEDLVLEIKGSNNQWYIVDFDDTNRRLYDHQGQQNSGTPYEIVRFMYPCKAGTSVRVVLHSAEGNDTVTTFPDSNRDDLIVAYCIH